MNTCLISIIVPVYNVSQYISKCLDSLIKSWDTSIEILVIDDGSTDGSSEICDEYATQLGVKVFHKQNGGLSDARNYGLNNAKGKYVIFVDSDDFVDSAQFKMFIREIARFDTQHVDVIFNDAVICSGRRQFITNRVKKAGTGVELLPNYIYGEGGGWNVWRLAVSQSFLRENALQFELNWLSEDVDFTLTSLYCCNNPAFIHIPYYYYQKNRPGSIMSGNIECRLKCLLMTLSRWERKLINTKENPVHRAILHSIRKEYFLSSANIWYLQNEKRKELARLFKNTQTLSPLPGNIVCWSWFLYCGKKIKGWVEQLWDRSSTIMNDY